MTLVSHQRSRDDRIGRLLPIGWHGGRREKVPPSKPHSVTVTTLRVLKRLASVAVVVGSIVFLVLALRSSWSDIERMVSDTRVLFLATGLSLAYGLLIFILFGSWFYTLRQNSPARVSVRAGAYVYAVSNIAKYLPGNVFHFAGRQILGARVGWSHYAIAQATLLEIAAMVTGLCVIILVVGLSSSGDALARTMFGDGSLLVSHWRNIVIALLICGAGALVILSRVRILERIFGVSPRAFLIVLCLDTAFFALYALLAVIFASQLPVASEASSWATVIIAYLLAWLAGFVVLGAPAGLGVREAVLVLLLSGTAGDGNATALGLGLGMRFVNTLGDALSAGLAYALGRSPIMSFAAASGE